jgi:hypothetical protein
MAINPGTRYPGKMAPAVPAYPYGQARNITNPGDGTGTPWEADVVNDLFGLQQALLSAAAVVPSTVPEAVGASQYLQAIVGLASGRGNVGTDSGLVNAVVLALPVNVQAPAAYFDGYTIRFKPAVNNTGAATINVAALGLKDLRSYLDEALTGGELLTTIEAVAVYHAGTGRFRLQRNATAMKKVLFSASGNYTPSPGARLIFVEVVGGGGGGGGADGGGPGNGFNAGSSGAGGGYAAGILAISALAPPVVVTVGAGGTAGTGAAQPTDGGTSSFGAFMSATGGTGGGSDTGAPSNTPARGSSGAGVGGLGAGGLINLRGGAGRYSAGYTTTCVGAGGGHSAMGYGGGDQVENANGRNGQIYGGGGGAAASLNTNTDYNGGTGAAGVVVITEVF